MNGSHIQESLKKFKKTIRSLDLDKRVAATKWLEGVIVVQSLTPDERHELVRASNEYIGDFEEGEYADAVNAMIEYLTREREHVLKKSSKRLGKNQCARH